jgi:hypothetical protein
MERTDKGVRVEIRAYVYPDGVWHIPAQTEAPRAHTREQVLAYIEQVLKEAEESVAAPTGRGEV